MNLRNRTTMKSVLGALLISAVCITGCGGSEAIVSERLHDAITIDGKDDDWHDHRMLMLDDGLGVAAKNDDMFLYVLIKVANRDQIFPWMHGRIITWFDPAGNDEKTFGIQFPLPTTHPPGDRESNVTSATDPFNVDQREFTLYESGEKEGIQISLFESKGLELHCGNVSGTLVYEMKVPLHGSKEIPYAMNAKGPVIGVGFETVTDGERRRPEGRPDEGGISRGEMDGTGRAPGRGMHERNGTHRPPGASGAVRKEIHYWLTVILTTNIQPE